MLGIRPMQPEEKNPTPPAKFGRVAIASDEHLLKANLCHSSRGNTDTKVRTDSQAIEGNQPKAQGSVTLNAHSREPPPEHITTQ